MASSVSNDEGDFGFQIAPMVDIVFVLMLFFMACAGVQVMEREIGMGLPSRSSGKDAVVPIILDVRADGQVGNAGRVFDPSTRDGMPELTDFLQKQVREYGGKDPVIIRPAADCPHGHVMKVLDTATKAGVTKISFD